MVGPDDLAGRFFVAKLGGPLAELVIENVGNALVEDQRQNEILKLGGVGRTANGTGRVPQPHLKGRNIQVLVGR